MKHTHAIHLLTQELEKAQSKKVFSEKYFAEHGGGSTLGDFCRSLELIEDYEEAIKILKKANRKGGEPV